LNGVEEYFCRWNGIEIMNIEDDVLTSYFEKNHPCFEIASVVKIENGIEFVGVNWTYEGVV
jgi:hypothetical protein